MNRWIRGFYRLGLVLGTVSGIAAFLIGVLIAVENYNNADYEFRKFACLLREIGDRKIEGQIFKTKAAASSCGYFSSYDQYLSLEWSMPGERLLRNGVLLTITPKSELFRQAIFEIGVSAIAALASFLTVFGLCRLIGWIFAGFSKTS